MTVTFLSKNTHGYWQATLIMIIHTQSVKARMYLMNRRKLNSLWACSFLIIASVSLASLSHFHFASNNCGLSSQGDSHGDTHTGCEICFIRSLTLSTLTSTREIFPTLLAFKTVLQHFEDSLWINFALIVCHSSRAPPFIGTFLA